MSGVDFLDSNVIVYALDAAGGAKGDTAERILRTALRKHSAIISFQVVQETLHVIGRKFRAGASTPALRCMAERWTCRNATDSASTMASSSPLRSKQGANAC